MAEIPAWMNGLTPEDLAFVRHFLLSSGSLKEMAALYGVTYPTIRLRLDRLIQKIRLNEAAADDPFVALLRRMVRDHRLEAEAADALLEAYRQTGERRGPAGQEFS